MSSAIKILPHYTYEDYCKWEGRWEIIEGIPYAMSPAPSPQHQWISNNIKYELTNAIKKTKCSHCKVYDFIDVKVTDDTVLQPDAVVVCKPISKKFLDFPAALVVEILSPGTALKDRHNKFSSYEKMGIPYYLIVDTDNQTIEIYSLVNGQYQKIEFDATKEFIFSLADDCNIPVVLNNIWE